MRQRILPTQESGKQSPPEDLGRRALPREIYAERERAMSSARDNGKLSSGIGKGVMGQ